MLIIGLMSGTSVDAIDAALVHLERDGDTLNLTLRAFAMLPFAPQLRERVRALMPPHAGTTAAVCEVNMMLGEAFAAAALELAATANVPVSEVELIASHGQTIYHQVASGATRSTLQIGAPAVIAERTGCTVVADFRPRDMAIGGEGAPLVSYLDALLFRDSTRYRAVQNIGGIGNVTYLAPTTDASNAATLAFDTGPGNVLIDEAMRLVSGGTLTFDEDGSLAASGQVNAELLAEWLCHPYFERQPPKSTGREAWGPDEARRYVEQGQAHGLVSADIIATLTALTARSIAMAYRRYLGRVDEVYVSGGGARNPTLLRFLQAELPDVAVRLTTALALDPDAKEAIAFALLGYATLHGWPGNVPTATGATHEVPLGSITLGHNYRALLGGVIAAPATPPSRLSTTRHRIQTSLE